LPAADRGPAGRARAAATQRRAGRRLCAHPQRGRAVVGVRDPAVPALPRSRPRAAGRVAHPRCLRPAAGFARLGPPLRHRRYPVMYLLAVGCSFRNTPVGVRERLAFGPDRLPAALAELGARYGCEAVILSTCNRVELYLARAEASVAPDVELIAEFVAEFHRLPPDEGRPHLYHFRDADAVRHLFRVTASLDSMIVGEGQIAGQVKAAYELADAQAAVSPVLHVLFQHAQRAAKRVRTETGI